MTRQLSSGRRRVRPPVPTGTEQIRDSELARAAAPGRLEQWRTKSASGAMFTAVALGFQQVFEPEREEIAIVMPASGEPPKDLPVEADLGPFGYRQSSVMVRPWLLGADILDTAMS